MATPENHKMLILIRKDLTMRKGKMIAQGSHAVAGLTHKQTLPGLRDLFSLDWWKQRKQYYRWFKMGQKKICLGVESEEELLKFQFSLELEGIPTALIVDEGLTEFNGVHTTTCLAAGPVPAEQIDKVTGHLKPL